MKTVFGFLLCLVVFWPSVRAAEEVSDVDAYKFATTLAENMVAGKFEILDENTDWVALGKRAVDGIPLKKEAREACDERFAKNPPKIGAKMGAQKKQDSVRFLRIFRYDDRKCALFRYMRSGGGVAYHAYQIGTKDAKVVIVDMFIFQVGEWMSNVMRRSILPLAEASPSALPNADQVYLANLSAIQKMNQAYAARDYAGAMNIYQTLPESLRVNKNIMISRISNAQRTGEAEYHAALDDLQKWFPDDPAMDMVLLDYYGQKKEFAKGHAALERLSLLLGGDAYLTAMDGAFYLYQHKADKAQACAQAALKMEPEFVDAKLLMLNSHVQLKAYPQVLEWLLKLEGEKILSIAEVVAEPEYADFVKSEVWTKYNAGKASK